MDAWGYHLICPLKIRRIKINLLIQQTLRRLATVVEVVVVLTGILASYY